MKLKIKKSIAFMMLLLTIFTTFSNVVFAQTEISSAKLQNGGDCGYHLQFWDSNRGVWSYIITTFVYYNENGKEYPAYCLNRELPRSRRTSWW